MTRRFVTACLPAAMLTVLLSAGPAVAGGNPLGPREGADPGRGLSAAATIGLFVLIPLGIMGLIAFLVLLPGMRKGARYRPQRGWSAAPIWFAGPPHPADAVAAVVPAPISDVKRGGASGSW